MSSTPLPLPLFVLGAESPDVAAIRQILTHLGIGHCAALVRDGSAVRRVRIGEKPDLGLTFGASGAPPSIVTVEVDIDAGALPESTSLLIVNPIDRPASKYWRASSIGQVWSLLSLWGRVSAVPPTELLWVAALRHREAALAGRLDGVDFSPGRPGRAWLERMDAQIAGLGGAL